MILNAALRLILGTAMLGVASVSAAPALTWHNAEGYRWTDGQAQPPSAAAGFKLLLGSETGIVFTNVLSQARSLTNQIYLNGSGVALGDVDGDGWCDIFLCGLDSPNALYRNLGGWHFQEITREAGVACSDQASTGAVLADVDGDGDLDLLVNGIFRGTRLWLNDGHARFREFTAESGLASGAGGTSLTLGDIDGDGLIDLYVANYRSHTLRDEPDTRFKVAVTNGQYQLLSVDGRPASSPELIGRFTVNPNTGILENGEPDVLYRNLGKGRFAALSWTDGRFRDAAGRPVAVPYDWALSAMFRDINGDGSPDLYVCNDFHSGDRIWINDRRGNFHALPGKSLRHMSLFSMGVDFADIDRDGLDDIVVADMLSRSHARRQVQIADRTMLPSAFWPGSSLPQYSRNMLFWNRGAQIYSEIAQLAGVEAADWCWCPVFLDVDLDGYEDLLMVTGHERDAQNLDVAREIEAELKQRPRPGLARLQLRKRFPVYDTPNFAFRNRHDLTFEEVGHAWGFDSPRVSQGIALGDLDNDGDLDVVINCLNAPPLIYRNESPAPRVAVRLAGMPPNTRGIGARITVHGGAVDSQSQEVMAGGRYLSSDDPARTFAAGTNRQELRIEVVWRSGRRSLVEHVLPNRIYEIAETNAPSGPPVPPKSPTPWFQELSAALEHRHQDREFDDFGLQPLLPRRFSRGGPGVSWFDLDGNGTDDLLIGAGTGGQLAAFLNTGNGEFRPRTNAPFSSPVTRDQTTVLGWHSAPGEARVWVGSANYEDGLTNGSVARLLDLTAGSVLDVLPGQSSSTGPLALADADGDGNLELFVGGQVVHGQYPAPATSLLFRNNGQTWSIDERASEAFRKVGLVNGAVWSDLTGDGLPELVLATEWGPLRVFTRKNGTFVEITEELSLAKWTGWWQSVDAADFDGDGRMDLVAGNWGRNSKYQSFLDHPLRLYAGDLNGDGRFEIVEAYYAPDLKKVVPWRDWERLAKAMPFLYERYGNFTQFSTAGADEILGPRLARMGQWSVTGLESQVFLNRPGGFEARTLPVEVQAAPVFGLVVADFDGDGREDLFTAQNFFGPALDLSPYDAGLSVLLKGRGDGTFEVLSRAESGVEILGDARGAAASDYDGDGRLDFAVGQNGGATRLFHNQRAAPGLRVRLKGPAGNPDGIGAIVRAQYGSKQMGPAREVHAGGGYWSQNSTVQVLGRAQQVTAIQVTWPGGMTKLTPVEVNVREFTVSHPAAH